MSLGTNWKLVRLIQYVTFYNIGMAIINSFNWGIVWYYMHYLGYVFNQYMDISTYLVIFGIALMMLFLTALFWKPYKTLDVYLIVVYTLMYTIAVCNTLLLVALIQMLLTP